MHRCINVMTLHRHCINVIMLRPIVYTTLKYVGATSRFIDVNATLSERCVPTELCLVRQLVRPRSLSNVFFVRRQKPWIIVYAHSANWRLIKMCEWGKLIRVFVGRLSGTFSHIAVPMYSWHAQNVASDYVQKLNLFPKLKIRYFFQLKNSDTFSYLLT